MKNYIATLAACLLASCATPPSKIAAVPVAGNPYQGFTCDQLKTERTFKTKMLTESRIDQRKLAAADTVAVILVGVPVSPISPKQNQENIIGQLRGQIVAIDYKASDNGCIDSVFGSSEPKLPPLNEYETTVE